MTTIPAFDYESLISDALKRITTHDEFTELKDAIARIKDRI